MYEANKEFGKDVDTDELVDDMLRIKETMNTELPFRMFDLTELPGNAVQGVKLLSGETGYLTDAEKTRKQISTEMDNLIKQSGGENGLRQRMKTQPQVAQQVVTLMEKAADADSQVARMDFNGGKVTRNLAKAGEKLDKMGWSSFFKDKSAIQITSEKAKEDIVNSIDQSLMTGQTMFDVKKGGITATPYYNTRGQIEGFDIVQFTKELTSGKNDGEVIQAKARVTILTLTGKKLLAKLAQGDEKDARKVPNSMEITPMYKKIENPFPTDVASTEREYDDFISLGLNNDPIFNSISVFFNSGKDGTTTVKDNVLNYAKSQLYGKYSEEEIEESINKVTEGFKTGAGRQGFVRFSFAKQIIAKASKYIVNACFGI